MVGLLDGEVLNKEHLSDVVSGPLGEDYIMIKCMIIVLYFFGENLTFGVGDDNVFRIPFMVREIVIFFLLGIWIRIRKGNTCLT